MFGKTRRAWLALATTILVAACGSGGGGGSGEVSSSPDPGLTLTSTNLVFTAAPNLSAPPGQDIGITITNPQVASFAVGYPPGVTQPTWLNVKVFGVGSPYTLHLSVTPPTQVASSFTTTLRIVTATASQALIGYLDIDVAYQPNLQIVPVGP